MINDQEQRPAKADQPSVSFWGFSSLLMLALVVCYAVQYYVVVYKDKPYDQYLNLSDYGVKSFYVWQLLSYQFMHLNWGHLLINLAGLWLFGRALEFSLGYKNFLVCYFGAGFAGGILQGVVALVSLLLPESLKDIAAFLSDQFAGPVAGSSVGLCGILAALCLLEPGAGLRLFCCPKHFCRFPVKGRYLCWILLIIAAAFLVARSHPNLAHAGHFGGLLAGMAYIKLGIHQRFARANSNQAAGKSAVGEKH